MSVRAGACFRRRTDENHQFTQASAHAHAPLPSSSFTGSRGNLRKRLLWWAGRSTRQAPPPLSSSPRAVSFIPRRITTRAAQARHPHRAAAARPRACRAVAGVLHHGYVCLCCGWGGFALSFLRFGCLSFFLWGGQARAAGLLVSPSPLPACLCLPRQATGTAPRSPLLSRPAQACTFLRQLYQHTLILPQPPLPSLPPSSLTHRCPSLLPLALREIPQDRPRNGGATPSNHRWHAHSLRLNGAQPQ